MSSLFGNTNTTRKKPLQFKTFDELYNEFCEELKSKGNSIDLCEKLKTCASDLNRIQLILSYSPSVVHTFSNSIFEYFDGKDEEKAWELFHKAKSMNNNILTDLDNDKAIEILNNALFLAPFHFIDLNAELQKWLSKDKLLCIEWFLAREVVDKNNGECGITPSCNVDHNKRDQVQFQAQEEEEEEQLVAKIYMERANRFNYKRDHESCILDIFTAIFFGHRKTFDVVYCLGISYKSLGHFNQANLIFQQPIEILRDTRNLWSNQRKSKETLRIVKQLKEIKSMNRTEGEDIKEKITTKRKSTTEKRVQQQQRCEEEKMAKVVEREKCALFPNAMKTNLYCGPSSTLIAASEALQLKHNDELGRHLIAKKTIPSGSILILEKPYSWSLYPEMYKDFCQHCCKELPRNWVPCQRCSAIAFCSWKCFEKAEQFHKFECPILKLLNSSTALGQMGLLCYRTITITSFPTLEQFLSQLEFHKRQLKMKSNKNLMAGSQNIHVDDDKSLTEAEEEVDENALIETLLCSSTEEFLLDPGNYISTFAQSTNSKARPSGDILKRILVSIYFTICLRFTGFFDYHQSSSLKCHSNTEEELPNNFKARLAPVNVNNVNIIKSEKCLMDMSKTEFGICALLLRHLQSNSCNAYGMNAVHISSNTMRLYEFCGAVYPTISLTNHSCNPNIYRYQIDGKLCAVKSIIDIAEGEQVFDCYGWNYLTNSKEQRQTHLNSNYFFKCQCQPCIENWPLYTKLQLEVSKRKPCPQCNEKTIQNKSNKKKNITCGKCHQLLKEMMHLETRYLRIKKTLMITKEKELLEVNYIEWESTLTRYISVLQSLYQLPDKRIVECQEALKYLWNLSASFNLHK